MQMTLNHNDTEFQGFDFTIISANEELSPELVSDVTKVRSSGTDAGIVEKRVYNNTKKFLEVSDTEYGDHYEVTGISDGKGTAALEEICQEGDMVTIISDDCPMIDNDWEILDVTVRDESIMADDNQPRYFFTLVLQE